MFGKKQLRFIALFALLGLVAVHVPVVKLEGSLAAFTLFDFFAPIAGGFIGALPGVISVLTVQVIRVLTSGGFGAWGEPLQWRWRSGELA